LGTEALKDAFSFAIATVASRFPQYTFEDILDRTPLWLDWAMKQAIRLEVEGMRRMRMAFSGTGELPDPLEEPKQPKDMFQEKQSLEDMGFKVRREK
jgi:hypothetical protein